MSPDSERIRVALAQALERPGLAFAEAPRILQAEGGEHAIWTLRLAGVPDDLAGPMILRRHRPECAAPLARMEGALHEALARQGYPVPRVHAVCEDAALLGGAFLLMDRVPGRVLLEEVGRMDSVLGSVTSALRTLPRLLAEAAWRVPAVLDEALARLHALDPAPFEAAVLRAGFAVAPLTGPGRVSDLEQRVKEADLPGLAPALAWLREHYASPERRVLCHGDLQFLNVLVEGKAIRGVIDWSPEHFAFEDPHFDLGNTTALLALRLPGLPGAVRVGLEAVQRRMLRRLLALQRRRGLADRARIRWAEAFRYVREMVVAGEMIREGRSMETPFFREDEAPWLIPEVQAHSLRAITARTGVPVSLPEAEQGVAD